MGTFTLMSSDHFHVILHPNKQHGLLFNRLDGSVSTMSYDDAKELSNLKAMGSFYGIVGHYLGKYLVLIKSRSFVGSLYEPKSRMNHDIYVITQVQVVNVSNISNLSAECSRTSSVKYDATSSKSDTYQPDMTAIDGNSNEPQLDQEFTSLPITISSGSYSSRSTQWNPFKIANSLKPMVQKQFLKSVPIATNTSIIDNESSCSSHGNTGNQRDDSDKRLIEEMVKLFNNANSFYYSPSLDLTNRFSRLDPAIDSPTKPMWKTADERFFWNKYMLKDLIELSEKDADANCFICVILQGFIAIKNHAVQEAAIKDFEVEKGEPATIMNTLRITGCNTDCDNESSDKYVNSAGLVSKEYQLALISRRSVFQAGTRYRRRGCDDDGNSANFVETEQVLRFNQHFKSLVLLRGSIPLYWFQTGYNYRPPPVLVRTEEENQSVFAKHFDKLVDSYKTERIISVDCTEQCGREKALHDAYKRHIERISEIRPEIELVEFDFHKHCRGRQCTDAQIEKHLISCGLSDQMMKDIKYYWNDGDIVLNQEGIFRVNCLDCSDRTNVVQRAIALKILDLQLARLGVISPDTPAEDNECRRIMQIMWTDNGNVLSTQYCGTRALFGGDKKLAGYLKDTYSSASRYYISKFRDSYRQAAIDAMLGVESVESSFRGQSLRDRYDIINFDPLLASRTGGALLRGVGDRVTNRLARLRGKLNVRPFPAGNMSTSSIRFDKGLAGDEPEMIEDTLDEASGHLNIDWPSSEDVNHEEVDQATGDLYARYSNADDSFQDDDEFSQLMLSIDVAELQQLREEPELIRGGVTDKQHNPQTRPEEINMTETPNPKKAVTGLQSSTTTT